MLTLTTSTRSNVQRICGNLAYLSEIQRAEDVVNQFADVPRKLHVRLICFILLCYSCRDQDPNTHDIGIKYQVDERAISLELDSKWGTTFKEMVSKSWKKDRWMEDMARTIFLFGDGSLNFVHRVAIFEYVFSFLIEQGPGKRNKFRRS